MRAHAHARTYACRCTCTHACKRFYPCGKLVCSVSSPLRVPANPQAVVSVGARVETNAWSGRCAPMYHTGPEVDIDDDDSPDRPEGRYDTETGARVDQEGCDSEGHVQRSSSSSSSESGQQCCDDEGYVKRPQPRRERHLAERRSWSDRKVSSGEPAEIPPEGIGHVPSRPNAASPRPVSADEHGLEGRGDARRRPVDNLIRRATRFLEGLRECPDSDLHNVTVMCVREMARRGQQKRLIDDIQDVIDSCARTPPIPPAAQAGIPVADNSDDSSDPEMIQLSPCDRAAQLHAGMTER